MHYISKSYDILKNKFKSVSGNNYIISILLFSLQLAIIYYYPFKIHNIDTQSYHDQHQF